MCSNFQLQDTLLQREEELARLQDENNQLREFLNSSFVRNLEQKAKVHSLSSSENSLDTHFVNNNQNQSSVGCRKQSNISLYMLPLSAEVPVV